MVRKILITIFSIIIILTIIVTIFFLYYYFSRTGILSIYTQEYPVTVIIDGKNKGTFLQDTFKIDIELPYGKRKVRLEFPSISEVGIEEYTININSFRGVKINSKYLSPATISRKESSKKREENIRIAKNIVRSMDVEWKIKNTPFPEIFLNYFGRTKNEVIEKNGDIFSLISKEIPDYANRDYNKFETIVYDGLSFVILFNEKGNFVQKLNIEKAIEYVQDIYVGCDFSNIINILGIPSSKDVEMQNIFYSYKNDYSIIFKIDHDMKVEMITVMKYILF
jgi:hypothetical protein